MRTFVQSLAVCESMEYVLVAENLSKRYGNYAALKNFNMHVEKGDIYGFVGRNGAGKTTLMRVVCGLQRPTEGGYRLYGNRHDDKNIADGRRRIGAIIETPSIYPEMTAEENLREQCRVLGLPSFDGVEEILKYVGLMSTDNKKAKNFSLGMRQRLGIAVSLVGSPDLLILDEPINGLDPQGIVEIRELILRLNRDKGITVIISSHILGELSKLATRYGFIDKGCMIKEITAEQLELECKKCLKITVSSVKNLPLVLDRLCIQYNIISMSCAEIYSDVNIGELTMELLKEKIDIIKAVERDEDLESYYINLIGGAI